MPLRHQGQGGGRYWGAGLVAGLLLAVLAGPGHGQDKPERAAREGHLAKRLHVQVHHGRLSVDLWEAEVGEVLARIAQTAGVIITGSPISGVRVSAQFTDVELEAGLRRLLQRASVSHVVRYARDPTGAIGMQEVRVFGVASEGLPAPLNATTRAGPARTVRSRAGSQPPVD
jgi:hypothetical protein